MKDFVSCELAKKLKEKGFDEECYMYYEHDGSLSYNIVYDAMNSGVGIYSLLIKNSKLWAGMECTAPTISQVLKWLRKEKLILIGLSPMQEYDSDDDIECIPWCARIYKGDKQGGLRWEEELYYQSYEATAVAGIEYVIYNLI